MTYNDYLNGMKLLKVFLACLLHSKLSAGLQIRNQRRLVADPLEVIDGQRDLCRSCNGKQMQHCVGGPAWKAMRNRHVKHMVQAWCLRLKPGLKHLPWQWHFQRTSWSKCRLVASFSPAWPGGDASHCISQTAWVPYVPCQHHCGAVFQLGSGCNGSHNFTDHKTIFTDLQLIQMEVKPSECIFSRILKVKASPAFMHFAIRWHSARLTGTWFSHQTIA